MLIDALLLQYPFFQRAIIAGLVTALVCGMIGILTVLRNAALYSDALAHSSLIGVAVGLILGFHPVLGALASAILIAAVLSLLTYNFNLSTDNVIAVILPVSIGLAVVLMSFSAGYQPELVSYLFGSILAVSWTDIYLLVSLSLAAIFIFLYFHKQLFFVFLDPDYAQISGISVTKMTVLYNLLLAITIVIAIEIVGVILVNALLVIPTMVVRLFSKNMTDMLWLTPIVGMISMILGILAAVQLDIPTGPAIAVSTGLLYFLSLWFSKLRLS